MSCWAIFLLIFVSENRKTKHHKTPIKKTVNILLINILTIFYLYFSLDIMRYFD